MISTAQFHAAIARHIDETKPDPLAKRQLESICLRWKGNAEEEEGNQRQQQQHHHRTSLVNGVLTLSSEYISIVIRVVCEYIIPSTTKACDESAPNEDRGTNDRSEDVLKSFDDEFYFQLTVHAKLKSKTSIADEGDDINSTMKKTKEQQHKIHKLNVGMINRLQSNVSVRRLLLLPDMNRCNNNINTVNKSSSNIDEGIILCEALIQRNRTTQSCLELEERVNVDESVLDGIRSAIYSHAEDNLDILELLLNMPYLPRIVGGLTFPNSNDLKGQGGEEGEDTNEIPPDTTMTIINELAQRAYLRLLEDALFDACEKEGEDELLDDLTIT